MSSCTQNRIVRRTLFAPRLLTNLLQLLPLRLRQRIELHLERVGHLFGRELLERLAIVLAVVDDVLTTGTVRTLRSWREILCREGHRRHRLLLALFRFISLRFAAFRLLLLGAALRRGRGSRFLALLATTRCCCCCWSILSWWVRIDRWSVLDLLERSNLFRLDLRLERSGWRGVQHGLLLEHHVVHELLLLTDDFARDECALVRLSGAHVERCLAVRARAANARRILVVGQQLLARRTLRLQAVEHAEVRGALRAEHTTNSRTADQNLRRIRMQQRSSSCEQPADHCTSFACDGNCSMVAQRGL
jgi:hypothetical protein